MKSKFLFLFVCIFTVNCSIYADDYAANWKKAFDFLAGQQNEDGSFSKKKGALVGITALVVQGWNDAPESVKKANPEFKARIEKAAAWLATKQSDSGFIADGPDYANYSTSLAVEAFAGLDAKKYAPLIAKAAKYIEGLQATGKKNFDENKHITFGGFGYGSTLRPDLSNTWFALSALKDAGVPADSQIWKDALKFVKRCQNSTEVNDQKYAGNDGGAMYQPGISAAGKQASRDGKEVQKSFGSMSAAMLDSYLMCGLKENDLPVKLSAKWLADNWTVKANPGHQKEGQQALYYYYRALAIALTRYGKKDFFGKDWKKELAMQIVSLQQQDGSWLNKESRFNENNPVLCTGYALTALGLCCK